MTHPLLDPDESQRRAEQRQARVGASHLLTYREAAGILNVVPKTVANLVCRGELRAVRFGRNVRIDPADLRDFIERAKGDTHGQ